MPSRKTSPFAAALGVLRATLGSGGRHELGLFASAIAFSLVVALAPLTLALSILAPRLAAATQLLPGSPLAGRELSPEQLYAGVASAAGPIAPLVVIGFVLWGASSVFVQMSRAIDRIWEQGSEHGGLASFVRQHVIAVMLLVVCVAALFASSVAGNALAGLGATLESVSGATPVDLGWVSALLSSRLIVDFAFSALLYAVAFSVVPRARPRVSDILPGAFGTAAAYAVGQAVLGAYLTSSPRFGALGGFGSVLAFMTWALYTSIIVLWGAELTHEIAVRRAQSREGTGRASRSRSIGS